MAPALAQNTRTFVSGSGSDSGNCALTTPCRTFTYAITQTSAGGEIVTARAIYFKLRKLGWLPGDSKID